MPPGATPVGAETQAALRTRPGTRASYAEVTALGSGPGRSVTSTPDGSTYYHHVTKIIIISISCQYY